MDIRKFGVLTAAMLLIMGGIALADPTEGVNWGTTGDLTPSKSLPMEIGTKTPSVEPVAWKPLDLGEAPGIIEKLPPIKNVLLYELRGSEFHYASMFDVLKWNGLALSVGYSPKDVAVIGASYDIFTLEKFGVTTPILKHIGAEPFIGMGLGRLDLKDTSDANEKFYIGLNILSLRFW